MAKIPAYTLLAAASILTTDLFPIQPVAAGAATRNTTMADVRTAVFTKTSNASGANAAAAALTCIANLSTGTGTPGTIIFQVGAVGSTGSTVQTATTVLTIGDQTTTFVGSLISVVGKVGLGASPGTTGALNIDAASYSTVAFRVINATVDYQTIVTASNAQFGTISNHPLVLFANNNNKWNILNEAGGTSSFVSANTTARIVGGSTNGLDIRDSTNSRSNLGISDNGATFSLSSASRVFRIQDTAAGGERNAGWVIQSGNSGTDLNLHAGQVATTSARLAAFYYDGTQDWSAWEFANTTSGKSTLKLMTSGGVVSIGSTAPHAGAALLLYGNTSAHGAAMQFINQAASGNKNWEVSTSISATGTMSWTPSTANDGTTFTTNVMTLGVTGILTTSSDITSGGEINLPAGNNLNWSTRVVINSSGSGVLRVNNSGSTAGVSLDVATDGTLKVQTRAGGDTGIISASQHVITGTNGTHFVVNTAATGGLLAGLRVQAGNGKALNLHGGTTAADIMQGVYYNQTSYLAAWSVAAVASGFSTLNLMTDGGAVDIGATTPSTLGYALIIRGNSANGIGIRLLNQASSGVKNWAYGPGLGGAGTSEVAWVPSTAADGSTFTTNVMKIDTVGRLTLTSGVTAGGVCAVNGATASSTTALITTAGTTGVSSLRVPHGAAPTSPVDGDMWSTTTTLNFRLNGVTKSVTLI